MIGPCAECGKRHVALRWAVGPAKPVLYEQVSKGQRVSLTQVRAQIRTASGTYSFLRGRLTLPVTDAEQDFSWLVWAEVTQQTWDFVEAHFADSKRDELAPFFGWLDTELPYAETTLDLPVTVQLAEAGRGSDMWINSGVEHPLVAEMTAGITTHRVAELNRLALQLRFTTG